MISSVLLDGRFKDTPQVPQRDVKLAAATMTMSSLVHGLLQPAMVIPGRRFTTTPRPGQRQRSRF